MYKLVYKKEIDKDSVKILDEIFVKNNEDKCILVGPKKIFELNQSMKVKKNSDEYTIILVELEEVNDYSYMFLNCEIKEFCLLGGDDKKENIEQNKIENNKENKALDLSKSNNSFYDIN